MQWHHAVYGASPYERKQAFLLRPARTELLTSQHLDTLEDVITRTDPASRHKFALTFANLSRSSVSDPPGQGALAIILSLRLREGRDSQGRRDPAFKHALLVTDAQLSAQGLSEAALQLFYEAATREPGLAERVTTAHHHYRRYQEAARALPQSENFVLARDYLSRFKLLHPLGSAATDARFQAATPAWSILYVVYPGDRKPLDLVGPAALLTMVLWHTRSAEDAVLRRKIRWAVVDLLCTDYDPPPDGLCVRFVPEGRLPDRSAVRVVHLGNAPGCLPWPGECAAEPDDLLRRYAEVLLDITVEAVAAVPAAAASALRELRIFPSIPTLAGRAPSWTSSSLRTAAQSGPIPPLSEQLPLFDRSTLPIPTAPERAVRLAEPAPRWLAREVAQEVAQELRRLLVRAGLVALPLLLALIALVSYLAAASRPRGAPAAEPVSGAAPPQSAAPRSAPPDGGAARPDLALATPKSKSIPAAPRARSSTPADPPLPPLRPHEAEQGIPSAYKEITKAGASR